ncbi:MAG: NAD-dependent epimerase/dehydratase family protein [Acidimicrobiia bacterium]
MSGKKLLVTGATGQVALPAAIALAAHNEVWATARFTDQAARAKLEAAGAKCVALDLVDGDLSVLPDDFEYVVNFSVMKTNDWGRDLDGNAGGTGELMFHCRKAKAFLHCSSTAVYQPAGHHHFKETDALGDNHRVWEFIATYSINKIAAEAMARFGARHLQLPTTIARLNVPYGDGGGWPGAHLEAVLSGAPVPVYVDGPTEYNPIHDDDIVEQIEPLLAAASAPATIVNWGGNDTVSIEEWSTYLGELTGKTPVFYPTDQHIQSVAIDTTKQLSITGPCKVHWKDGFRRMATNLHPEALVG